MAGDRAETERALGLIWDSYAHAGSRPEREPEWMGTYGLGPGGRLSGTGRPYGA